MCHTVDVLRGHSCCRKKMLIQSMCFWWVSVAVWLNLNESTRRVFWMLNVVCDVQCCGFSTYQGIGARGRAAIRCNISPAPPGVSMATCPHCLLVSCVSDSCGEARFHSNLQQWSSQAHLLYSICWLSLKKLDHPKIIIYSTSNFSKPLWLSVLNGT